MTKNNVIVVALEATCWNGNAPKGQVSEIIEIGICVLNTKSGVISNNKGILVDPIKSMISNFCTELTSITPELIKKEGVSFKTACSIVKNEYWVYGSIWASYGAYDYNMFTTQCEIRNINFPLSKRHINVKELFTKVKGLKKKVGMHTALQILDIPLEGTHHRGVDDANNIAKILDWCLKQKDGREILDQLNFQ